METPNQNQPRISLLNIIALIAVAIVLDILSLIPFVNVATAIFGWGLFALWFYLLGFGLINVRRLVTSLSSLFVEAVPFLSFLPTFTVGVVAIILMINWKNK